MTRMTVTKKKLMTGIASMLLVGGAVALPASPAFALSGNGSFSATCDPGNYGHGSDYKTFSSTAGGTWKVVGSWNQPGITTVSVNLMSQNGNTVGAQTITNGGTASWNPVIKGTYHVLARSVQTVDCNGILAGKGNFTFNYIVTYP